MCNVIILKDGRREHINSARDFADMLDAELGLDARDYFMDIVDESDMLGEYVYERQDKIRDRLYEIGCSLEQAIKDNKADSDALTKWLKMIRQLEDEV